jgi:hypothetical protein
VITDESTTEQLHARVRPHDGESRGESANGSHVGTTVMLRAHEPSSFRRHARPAAQPINCNRPRSRRYASDRPPSTRPGRTAVARAMPAADR